jgi:hypothetical protein
MSEEDVQVLDEIVETGDQTAAESGTGSHDNFGAMQDRMAGDGKDSPWYSSSEGAVVDKDGDVLLNAKTGQPITSMDEYQKLVDQDKAAQTTAKPKTETPVQEKPMSKSFNAYVSAGKDITPEKIQEMAKAGSDYKYNDDLIPKIETATTQDKQPEKVVDPVEAVKEQRKQWEAIAVNPLKKVRDALLSQGADPALVDSAIIGPVMQEQMALVDRQYQTEYEKALRSSIEGKFNPTLSKIESDKLNNASNANIQALAAKYYPEGGKEAFFSLINGHYDEKGTFVRGPAAQVVDLMSIIAMDGKSFKNEAERNTAYADTFRKITADPAKARALFDVAHYFWIGKQSIAAQNILFQKGKEAAQKETQRVQRTVKTKPASYQAPSTVEDDENMPDILRASMGLPQKR